MAKITNIQTKIETSETDKTHLSSFDLLALIIKGFAATGMEQFWRRYEILVALKDKEIGAEVDLTSDQTKEVKEILASRKFVLSEEWAEFLTSIKPMVS